MFVLSPELRESVTSKLQEVVSKVNQLEPQTVISNKGLSRLDSILEVVEAASNELVKARKEQHGRDPESKELTLQIARVYNTTSGLQDVIKAGDAGSEAVTEFKKEVATLVRNFDKLVKKLDEANEGKERRALARVETGADNEWERELHQRMKIREQDEQDKQVLQKYNRYAIDMPTKDINQMGDKKLVMFDIPVIPITEYPLDIRKLHQIGITAEPVGGLYVVMLKQKIIGINPKAIKESKQKIDEYLEKTLVHINERTGKKWQYVSDNPQSYQSRGLQFYWIMEQVRLTRLIQLTHAPIDEWGFPFANDWIKKAK